MNISLYPPGKQSTNCLILVGGSGDTSEGFSPLVSELSQKLINYSICTFTFSSGNSSESILDIQAKELEEVFKQITNDYNFKKIDIFCTSQGSYSTIKLLTNIISGNKISKVIMYDPADYYISETNTHSWSGADQYSPKNRVISDQLKEIEGDYKVSVIHLTLRNYGREKYLADDFADRDMDHPQGYPRLNTLMVRGFYDKSPSKNRGVYIEEGDVPHAMMRDGNIPRNINKVASTLVDLLSK